MRVLREVASTVTSLAAVLHHMGKLDEANVLYRRALSIREATQGEGHPDSATALSNMAALLQMTGELSEAEALYRRALRILEGNDGSQKARNSSFYHLTAPYGIDKMLESVDTYHQRFSTGHSRNSSLCVYCRRLLRRSTILAAF